MPWGLSTSDLKMQPDGHAGVWVCPRGRLTWAQVVLQVVSSHCTVGLWVSTDWQVHVWQGTTPGKVAPICRDGRVSGGQGQDLCLDSMRPTEGGFFSQWNYGCAPGWAQTRREAGPQAEAGPKVGRDPGQAGGDWRVWSCLSEPPRRKLLGDPGSGQKAPCPRCPHPA